MTYRYLDCGCSISLPSGLRHYCPTCLGTPPAPAPTIRHNPDPVEGWLYIVRDTEGGWHLCEYDPTPARKARVGEPGNEAYDWADVDGTAFPASEAELWIDVEEAARVAEADPARKREESS